MTPQNGRARAEALAAQIISKTGCSVALPDGPIDGVWRLTISGRSSWTATVDVPVISGDGELRMVFTWPDSETAKPEHMAKLRAFADQARSWGWDVVDENDSAGSGE